MSVIVAIGGGELKNLETLPIDREIVRLPRKKNPKVLFIPTASADASGYVETFREIYGRKLGCSTDVLFLVREKHSKKEIERKILSADIIYVGGGNTLRMLQIWRKFGVDVLLRKAHRQGVVLAGLSAGAICWFRYGSSDARRFQGHTGNVSYMRVNGLGMIHLTASPHHVCEKSRSRGLERMMKRTPGVALALDDNAAIFIEDDRYRIVRSRQDAGVAKVFQKKGKIEKIPLKEHGAVKELSMKG